MKEQFKTRIPISQIFRKEKRVYSELTYLLTIL